jgi:hypothetical protein
MQPLRGMINEILHQMLGAAICFFLGFASSEAAVISVNVPSLGASADGFNITRDTITGLDWLDLDVSVGRTFNDLTGGDGSNEFIGGGDFDGFRYATKVELTGADPGPQLDSLYKSLGISPFDFSSIGGYVNARALITIVGCFGSCASYGYSYGARVENDGVTEAESAMEAFTSGGWNWGRSDTTTGPILFLPNNGFPLQKGNWLVRSTVVPVPTAVWLFGSALGLLGWMRRKPA